jgi:hypothetical protein
MCVELSGWRGGVSLYALQAVAILGSSIPESTGGLYHFTYTVNNGKCFEPD